MCSATSCAWTMRRPRPHPRSRRPSASRHTRLSAGLLNWESLNSESIVSSVGQQPMSTSFQRQQCSAMFLCACVQVGDPWDYLSLLYESELGIVNSQF